MTNTETIEAILDDLTAENQHQLLPILADALTDAGFDRQEQALRYALVNDKRPRTPPLDSSFLNGSKYKHAFFHDNTKDVISDEECVLPCQFQRLMVHEEDDSYLGRYYSTLTEAWRAFLIAAESHLELLLK